MAVMPAGASKVQIPRWIQLVGLPLVLLLLWVVARAVGHVVFLFLVAAIIALLLNPFVRALGRAKIPRGLAVAVVYLGFAAAVGVALLALATVVVDRTRSASNRVDIYFTNEVGQPPATQAERDLNRIQLWFDTHGLKRIQIESQGKKFLHNIGTKDVTKYTSKAISWAEKAGDRRVRAPVRRDPRDRGLDLHAARHAAVRKGHGPALPAARRRLAAARADGVRGLQLREGPGAALADHRRVGGARALHPRRDRPRAGAGPLRAPLRRLGRVHRADPVPRPVARLRCRR